MAIGTLSQEHLPVLSLINVTLGYHRHPAVHHLSLDVAAGSLLAIVGPNGAGKSTLLKGIAGRLPCLEGQITCRLELRSALAYLSQRSDLDIGFPIDVMDFVAAGLYPALGLWRAPSHAQLDRVTQALDTVGMSALARSPLAELSGGQLQRARFARVIVQDAALILLDEPYAAIDYRTASELAQVVQGWHTEGRTVISVLHDLAHVRAHYPRTLLLAREPIACGTSHEVLCEENLDRAQVGAGRTAVDSHERCYGRITEGANHA